MGHGEEPIPAETVEDLREEIAEQDRLIQRLRDKRPMIHAAMIKAMRLAKAVVKDGFNNSQNYPFRGIDGTLNVLGPALREAGVFVTPEVMDSITRDVMSTLDKKMRESVVRVKFTFWAEDGSSVSAVVPGESLDTGDKGSAKAMSVAFRTALLQVFALPTQEPTTDDNGHYHTRGGTPTLSGWTAAYGNTVMMSGSVDAVIGFWTAIVESSSIEVPWVPDGMTWGEATTTRLAQLIAEEQSPEVLRELYGKLKAADMLGLFHVDESGRYQLRDLVIEQGKTAKLNRDKAFDHCMALVTGAANLEALMAAETHIQADFTDGPLTEEQRDQLLNVAIDRRPKLHVSLLAPELSDTVPAEKAAPPEFLPPVGYAWNLFVAFVNRQDLTGQDIRDMLVGQWDKDQEAPAAHEYGLNGLIRLVDAVKRSNVRDKTIDNTDRANLLQLIRDTAHEHGIEISDANL